MGEAQSFRFMTADEYLKWEPAQTEKYEFIHGEIFLMGGASRRHVTVAGNIFVELDRSLENSPCRAYMADMKLQVQEQSIYFYPDVMVTCDPQDHRADHYLCSPLLIIEVLSDSTAAFDRGQKAAIYRGLPSLKEFVLLDPERRQIELYRRTQENTWELRDIPAEHALHFSSLDITIPWTRIFRNVD
ncbi:MAG: Uma2 family endonuclease [Desulfovermiculus sp.]|nr:Uma2 family endonuclease [Desulfovermiculus sp.]